MNARFALAMARREARSSWRRMALYGACMAVGVAALVGLQGLRATVEQALDAQSQELLGADLLLSSRAPWTPATRDQIRELLGSEGADGARITRFGSMVLAKRSAATRLVDVQGLEGGFPFYGEVRTEPANAWTLLATAERIALVDRSLLLQLDAQVGDEIALGHTSFRIAGAVTKSPGTFGMRTLLAPRVFIPAAFVEETGLVQRGSLVEHRLYVRAERAPLQAWLEAQRPALRAARVSIQTLAGYRDDLGRSFGALTRYLGLVGLAALMLGGIGVASGVRVLVRDKLDAVAVLRSLGASSMDVAAAYGGLALGLGLAAGTLGAALGLGFQWLLPSLLADFLPVEVALRLEPGALLAGVLLGLWITVLFAAAPLYDLARVPPLRALRRDFSASQDLGRGRAGLLAALGVSLLGASLWTAPSWRSGAAFALGLAVVLGLLAVAASALASWLRSHSPRRAPYWLRQGVANLFRPRNHTLATTLAIGLGVFLIATLHIVQWNLLRQLERDVRPDRPNLVLFDVQRDQLAELDKLLTERGAPVLERAPIISARVEAVAGVAASDSLERDDLARDRRWALGREYRVTYTDELRAGETVLEGSWWNDAPRAAEEPLPVSLEREIAELLEVSVGDSIAWSVQGVSFQSVVESIREVDWGRMGTNFFAIFPPGVLETAPQMSVLLARLESSDARAALQRDLVARFPNVSVLDATQLLRALDTLMERTSLAVRAVALFVLASGLLILLAAAAASRHERTREALLLRTLGSPSQTLRRIIVAEAAVLGALAALVGTGLALAASWALVRFIFELRFAPPWFDVAALACAAVAATALVGAFHSRKMAKQTPLAGLREAALGS